MPDVHLIDMRKDRGAVGEFLSPPLRGALEDVLSQGEQALLFLNRRGYAPLTLCAACGHKATCRNCSAWLVEHRYRRRLVCHHCGYDEAAIVKCPQCAAENSFIACGPGVERVEEEFRAVFPDARVAVASSDTLAGPAETQAAIRAMSEGRIDVLIGTQIVAKGHHFPQLTLAGVIDADLGGVAGDPRAAEMSFQMLHQVAGRSGRGGRKGQVLIQTRNPDDPVMRALASHARDDFYAEEIRVREQGRTPPFGRLAALILAGNDGDRVRGIARELALSAPKGNGVAVWGPAPAYYQVLRGRTRERLLVQAEKGVDVQAYLRAWLPMVKVPPSVQLSIDVDPISFF
jgi:primosomal protein N' (replication factor Y)